MTARLSRPLLALLLSLPVCIVVNLCVGSIRNGKENWCRIALFFFSLAYERVSLCVWETLHPKHLANENLSARDASLRYYVLVVYSSRSLHHQSCVFPENRISIVFMWEILFPWVLLLLLLEGRVGNLHLACMSEVTPTGTGCNTTCWAALSLWSAPNCNRQECVLPNQRDLLYCRRRVALASAATRCEQRPLLCANSRLWQGVCYGRCERCL